MAEKQTVLRFVLTAAADPMDIMSKFRPQGQTVLNRTEWRGKEPRSCAVTSMRGRPHVLNSNEPHVWDVEVSYRPKGTTTHVGNTKYDGWTAMILDRAKDGTLLDGHGMPLPEGQTPVFLPYELYKDTEFNEVDFGTFVEEIEVGGIKRVSFEEVMLQVQEAPRVSASINSTFTAPRRSRPSVKVILSNAPSGTRSDGFGTKIVNVNNLTPHLQQVLVDHLTELMSGFVEGRYSMKNLSTDEFVFAELSDSLVDCTPNEEGKDSRFDCLHEYLPEDFLEELARLMMAIYEVDASVVDGRATGILLRRRPVGVASTHRMSPRLNRGLPPTSPTSYKEQIMPAKKTTAKKSTGGKKGSSGPRELITPNGEGSSRYQRRNKKGEFGDSDQVSRSQPDDKAKKSKTKPPKGEGDKGDHPKRKK